MTLNVSGPFIYFTIPIFGGINITQTTVSSLLVTILVCGFCIALGKNLSTRPGPRQILVMLRDMVVSTMGAHNEHWTPFILTLFLSSLFGSLIGMTGFLRSSTADLSCTLVWALMVTAIIWYNNIKNSGVAGWLKGFTEPIAIMTPMNIISEIAQPISMAFRHFGNIVSGTVISTLIYAALAAANRALFGLIPGVVGDLLGAIPFLDVGIPAVFSLYFDWFSSFMQAFIFCMLTTMYIAAAAEPD